MSEFYCPHRDEWLTLEGCRILREQSDDFGVCTSCTEHPEHRDVCRARPLPEPKPEETPQQKAEQAKNKERQTMQNNETKVSPEQRAAFEEALKRVMAVTMTRTQVQLAEYLDIRQSSISDAKRRASIPSDWLIKIMAKSNANPQWILHGDEHAQYMLPSHDGSAPAPTLKYVGLEDATKELVEKLAEKHLSSGDLFALARKQLRGWDISVNLTVPPEPTSEVQAQ